MLSVKMSQTKFGDDAEAKKILAETTQLLDSVLVKSSKHTLTSETLKTKLRKVPEKTQELIKEEGKDDTELRDFAERFNRLERFPGEPVPHMADHWRSTSLTKMLHWRVTR